MCKSADRSMVIGDVTLWEKTGGRSGTYRRADDDHQQHGRHGNDDGDAAPLVLPETDHPRPSIAHEYSRKGSMRYPDEPLVFPVLV
jgi:hypothetical protein